MKFLEFELGDWKEYGPNFYRSVEFESAVEQLDIGLIADSIDIKNSSYTINCLASSKYYALRDKLKNFTKTKYIVLAK